MDTNDLKIFTTTYDNHSFSAASEKLFMSPQGVAKAINRMEADLSVQLFMRSKAGIKPTAYSHNLYNKATELELMFQSINAPTDDTRLANEIVSVFSTYGFLSFLGFNFFQSFQADHPETTLNLVEFPDSALRNMLNDHHANIGFINGPIDLKKYDGFFVARNHYRILVSPDNPLYQHPSLTFADLNGQALGIKGKEYDIYNRHLNKLIKRHTVPASYFETSEDTFLLEFVAQNLGVAIIPDFQVELPQFADFIQAHNLAAKELTGVEFMRDIYFVQVLDATLSPGEQAFRDFAQKLVAKNNS